MFSPPLWYSYGLKVIGIDGITHFIHFSLGKPRKPGLFTTYFTTSSSMGIGTRSFFFNFDQCQFSELERGNSRNERIDMFLILSVNRMIPVPDVTNSFPEYLTFYVCQRFNDMQRKRG